MRRATTEIPNSAWFKSTYSGGNETECVETAFIEGSTAVRDSKQLRGQQLRVQAAAWTGFISAVQKGQLG
ncbi:DUF397 domain-containing protein [Streptomyces sp. NBC_01410]|uniref:DUF397 domain-containing protein n=1 Tax=Streptomyces sp. NBC_01410 TaxID=2903856 RepID=UPI0032460053